MGFLSSNSKRLNDRTSTVQSVGYYITLVGSVQRCLFTGPDLDRGSLGHGDLINHETDTTLGDNIGNGVSELDVHLDRITLNT